MQESSLAEAWIYYDEFINTIHSETMLNSSPGPGPDYFDEFPGPLDLNELEKLFPPSPPFPGLGEDCSDLASIQLSCPHLPQYQDVLTPSSVESVPQLPFLPILFAVFCILLLFSFFTAFAIWKRRLRKGEPGILDEYLDSSLYQGIHPSIHSSIHSSGDRIPKSFTQESFKYQCRDSSGFFSLGSLSYPIYEEISARETYPCLLEKERKPYPCLLDSTEFPEYSSPVENLLIPSLQPLILRSDQVSGTCSSRTMQLLLRTNTRSTSSRKLPSFQKSPGETREQSRTLDPVSFLSAPGPRKDTQPQPCQTVPLLDQNMQP